MSKILGGLDQFLNNEQLE